MVPGGKGPWLSRLGLASAIAWAIGLASGSGWAQTCDDLGFDPEKIVYGGGGSTLTPTLALVATALQALPEDERLTLFYSDGTGACGEYERWRTGATELGTFKYWSADGVQATCVAPRDQIAFVHIGHTPTLCPGDVSLPDGAGAFLGPVQSAAFIVDAESEENALSAEAAYLIYGFGAGTYDIEPWNDPEKVLYYGPTSLISTLVGAAIGVPAAAQIAVQPQTDAGLLTLVDQGGTSALGFTLGPYATRGEQQQKTKTLAYQHYGQACSYLPDSEPGVPDRAHVRSGQYGLWTPSWFLSYLRSDGRPRDANVRQLIGWFNGSVDAPDGYLAIFNRSTPDTADDIEVADIQETLVRAGEVPLCAMQATRPLDEFSAIESYAPDSPCNGWYELLASGQTDYQECTTTADCDGARQDEEGNEIGEQCRLGFCEAY